MKRLNLPDRAHCDQINFGRGGNKETEVKTEGNKDLLIAYGKSVKRYEIS